MSFVNVYSFVYVCFFVFPFLILKWNAKFNGISFSSSPILYFPRFLFYPTLLRDVEIYCVEPDHRILMNVHRFNLYFISTV